MWQSLFRQDAHRRDKTTETTRRESSARKAHQEDGVGLLSGITRRVIRRKESVCLPDILRKADSESTTRQMIVQTNSSPKTGLVVNDLRVMVVVFRFDGTRDSRYIGGILKLPGLSPRAFLPSIVTINPCACSSIISDVDFAMSNDAGYY
jgi:hypothetical protein